MSAQTADIQINEIIARAEQGDARVQYNVGFMYEYGTGVTQNDQEAFKWYRLAAEQGVAAAQNNLGVMYSNGRGVIQNDQEAVKWYRLAAEQGYAFAQYNLGDVYANGAGVVQSAQRAYIWYSVAAVAQGYADAVAARDRAKALLTPQALQEAQQIATRCFDSNFKDCGE